MEKFDIEAIAKMAALSVSLAAAVYVAKTVGYFSIVGLEFLGVYFDANLVTGIVYVTPGVVAISSFGLFLFYWLYRFATHVLGDDAAIFSLMLFLDKLIILPLFVAVIFGKGEWVELKATVFLVSGTIVAAAMFVQYMHVGAVNVVSGFFLIFTLFASAKFYGEAEAYNDLSKKYPTFSIHTEEINYVNAVIMKSTSAGVLLRSGKEIVFYPSSRVIKISRDVPD